MNTLRVNVTATDSGSPCGVYVRGEHSRFEILSTTSRLAASTVETSVSLPPVAAGSELLVRQFATNRAGLAAVIESSQFIVVDNTPPAHPILWACTPSGRLGDDGAMYQPHENSVRACWKPPGFVDAESGIWALEWQLARRVGLVWETITGTQQLSEADTAAAVEAGYLDVTREQVLAVIGADLLVHPNRFRMGIRAVNRAGLRSCDHCVEPPCSCATEHRRDSPASIAAAEHAEFYSDWATESALEFQVDVVGPVCAWAHAWLCDPGQRHLPHKAGHDISLDEINGPVGGVGGGFQSLTDRLRVQWTGFSDYLSGIDQCDIEVLKVTNPGKARLGQRCVCSGAMPRSTCDCEASVATGARARCVAITEQVQSIAMSRPDSWRTSKWNAEAPPIDDAEDFAWAAGILDLTPKELGTTSACVPAEPFNAGVIGLSEGCVDDIECAPLSPMLSSLIHETADQRVVCTSVTAVPWLQRRAERFCCVPHHEDTAVCLPAAQARSWPQLASPPPHAPVAPPAPEGPELASPCSAVLVNVTVMTGDVVLPYEYSHISWSIDRAVHPPPSECVDELLCGGTEACGCLYSKSTVFQHSVCLAPGRHHLSLYDMMGFGWFGATLSLIMRDPHTPSGSHTVPLVPIDEEDATPTDFADIPTPVRCSNNCGDTTCADRLFFSNHNDGLHLCGELRRGGYECGGCCLETNISRTHFYEALPSHSLRAFPWWNSAKCSSVRCSAVRSRTFVFEVFDTLYALARVLPPPPPPLMPVMKMTVDCKSEVDKVQEVLLTGLQLEDGAAYTVGVRAVDRAGNPAVGCGQAGESRARFTYDMPWQRAIIVDAIPPVAIGPVGRVRDVNLLTAAFDTPIQPHEAPDADMIPAAPLHAACDWSSLHFVDDESSVTGYMWALSSDGARAHFGHTHYPRQTRPETDLLCSCGCWQVASRTTSSRGPMSARPPTPPTG